ncbi:uncharacterized protein KIAA0355-like [Notechis scutatus]|uniref:Uncharacterized protein KIAA0355-like n=1 Tax=Notechis scutatus TaxID=8663 RepID=A0A6J1VW36_9SAUR|nr:uncharacterized protein KIAA0355-like [Notechis scutatus]
MQQKRQAQHFRRPSNARSNWSHPDDLHRTWPFPEYFTDGEMTSSWSGTQGDSASSSDETSSANGDSLFSMFSGPDIVAAVKQRRKHSSGEQDTSTLPSPPLLSTVDDHNQDNKTKTWPPKAPWQHTQSGQNMSLYQLSSPASHWNDAMQMLPSPVWSSANDCPPPTGMASPFAYTQQPPQSPPLPLAQHKQGHKGFKPFPGKHERRPSYLPQY